MEIINLNNTKYIISNSFPIMGEPITHKIDVYNRDFKTTKIIRRFFFFKKTTKVTTPLITVYIPIAKAIEGKNIIVNLKEKINEILDLYWKNKENSS